MYAPFDLPARVAINGPIARSTSVNRDITQEMRETYDKYYRSHGYRERYPVPNVATLDYLLQHGAKQAVHILDFGCGDGRYARALLDHTQAHVTGYDISLPSLCDLERSLNGSPHGDRVTLVGGAIDNLHAGAYDLVLMLFGVLSHLGDRATRIETLVKLRTCMRPGARLILSVPSIYRRRPLDLYLHARARSLGIASPPMHEAGNIHFVRYVHGERLSFFYHLYTLARLEEELRAAGFILRHCEAESLFPEWWLMRSPPLQRLDRALAKAIPSALGYGIRAYAELL
jgi:SAM-dependent methyltransferase